MNDSHETQETALFDNVTPSHMMVVSYFIVHTTVESRAIIMLLTQVVLDTGSKYDVIRRTFLPSDLQAHRVRDEPLHRLGEANRNSISFEDAARHHDHFLNSINSIYFFLMDSLSSPILVATPFMN